jgi:hypothetical protein
LNLNLNLTTMNSNLGEGGMDIFADALDEFLPPPSPISPSSSSSSSSYGGADAEGGRTGMQRAIAAYFAAFPVSVVRRAMNLTSIRRGGIRILAIGDLAEEYLSAFPNSTVEEVAALIETALTHIKNQNRRRTAAALEEECTAVVEPEPKKRRRGRGPCGGSRGRTLPRLRSPSSFAISSRTAWGRRGTGRFWQSSGSSRTRRLCRRTLQPFSPRSTTSSKDTQTS